LKSLSHRAGLLMAGNAFKYAVGFGLQVVLVRLLSKQDYGSYQQLLLLGAVAVGVMPLGLPGSVYYFAHRVGRERQRLLVAQTLLTLFGTGLLSAVLLWLAAPWIARAMNNPALTDLVPLYAPYVLFYVASEAAVHVLISQDHYRRAVLLEAAEAMARAGILLVPLLLTGSVRTLVLSVSAYAVLRFVGFGLAVKPRPAVPGGSGWGPTFVGEQLAYGVPLALSMLVGLLGNLLDKAIIALSFGPEQYAIYSVGALELPLDVIFQASVANVLRASLPGLARDGQLDEIARVLRAAVRKLSLIVLPAFVFMLAFSHDFVVLVFTPEYVESVQVFRLYLLLIPLHCLVLSPVPQAFGLTRINLYISLSGVLVKAGLSYALLKVWGYYGPAAATVAANYFSATVYLVVILRLLRRSPAAVFPWGTMLRIVLVSAAVAVPVHALTAWLALGLGGFLLGALLFVAAFLALSRALHLLQPQDEQMLRGWLEAVRGLGRRSG
jgi:O-antigen/teichoic acid export membrane protein